MPPDQQTSDWAEPDIALGEIIRHYATKAEISQLEIRMIKWSIGLVMATAGAVASVTAIIINVFRI